VWNCWDKRRTKGKNGLRIKVLTSKAEPQMDGIMEIWMIDERTKGLKILKIKGMSFFSCVQQIRIGVEIQQKGA
jgi:hypothetical protein